MWKLITVLFLSSSAFAEDFPNYYGSISGGTTASAPSGTVALTSTYVGYGSGANTLTGDPSMTYVNSTGLTVNRVQIGANTNSAPLDVTQNGTGSTNGLVLNSGGGLRLYMNASNEAVFQRGSGSNVRITSGNVISISGTTYSSGLISTSSWVNVGSPTTLPTCNAANKGNVFMNTTTNCLNYCDGTANRQVTSLAASCS